MTSDREVYAREDPLRSSSHGRPTALWCLTVFGAGSRCNQRQSGQHFCTVDTYRNADHEHECRCGERESRS